MRGEGTWLSALALAAYAVAFSYAYLEIGAAAGALLLFGAVQLTMIVGGLLRGERPTPRQWLGWLVALSGLVVINAPPAPRISIEASNIITSAAPRSPARSWRVLICGWTFIAGYRAP